LRVNFNGLGISPEVVTVAVTTALAIADLAARFDADAANDRANLDVRSRRRVFVFVARGEL
jgi:hypothetical protein